MRRSYIAGNWKMNKTTGEAVALATELVEAGSSKNKVMVAPPFTALGAVAAVIGTSEILLGAQNMATVESGAHTGEISVLMLKDLGVDTVILGHSERRHVYGESNEQINKKVNLALKHGVDVILCVGETLDERESGKAESVVIDQLDGGLKGVSAEDLSSVTIAYEPVWAIGTGKTATPEDANAIHKVIRNRIQELYNSAAADKVIIQYGGSVKPGNVQDLMAQSDIDGALVGGAALKAETFIPIMNYNK